jgi:hypothetical protein
MNELSLNQMEMVSGGDMNQRNCLITGGVILIGLFGSIVSGPVGLGIASAGILAGTSGNCF